MDWYADNFFLKAEKELNQNVQAAAIYLQGKIRVKLSVAGRTVSKQQITKGKRKGQFKKVIGAMGSNPSKPGEAPHKQTGTLRSSIAWEMTGPARALVGSALKVAKWMELGVTGGKVIRPKNKKVLASATAIFGKRVVQGNIKSRPFLRVTAIEETQAINSIVGGRLPAPSVN